MDAELQLKSLFAQLDSLQSLHGDSEYNAIFGAGQIVDPELVLMFMNPTAKNISAYKTWKGIRAPWLGTKPVWKMLYDLGLLDDYKLLEELNNLKPFEWTEDFSYKLYQHVKAKSLYITNIAKCTFPDARPLSNKVYREYLESTTQELKLLNSRKVITFGNQVSYVLLGKNISVSNYLDYEHEEFSLNDNPIRIFPCYYPVGQGRRNMPLAKRRIKNIVNMEK